jgi:hypothetical protein
MEDPMKKVYFVAGDYAFTLQWGGVIRQGVVDVYAGLIDLADRKREVVTYVRTYPGTIGGVIRRRGRNHGGAPKRSPKSRDSLYRVKPRTNCIMWLVFGFVMVSGWWIDRLVVGGLIGWSLVD